MSDTLSKMVNSIVSEISPNIIFFGQYINENPEEGFKEFKTARLIEKVFKNLQLDVHKKIALTGITGTLELSKTGQNIDVIAEMDGVFKNNQITHLCGHNIQVAVMLGTAIALKRIKTFLNLSGRIRFIGMPGEEYQNINYRKLLKNKGHIRYFTGKPEFIRLGEFNNTDIALLTHAGDENLKNPVTIARGAKGFLMKNVGFTNINSGYAFYFENLVKNLFKNRVKTWIDLVNKKGEIKDGIELNIVIHYNSLEAMNSFNKRIDTVIKSYADNKKIPIIIYNRGGALPLEQNPQLNSKIITNSKKFINANAVKRIDKLNDFTDLGDLSHLVPVIQPFFGGNEGIFHNNFRTINEYNAYILPTKIIVSTIIDLLKNDCKEARIIKRNYIPKLDKATYEEYMLRCYNF